MDVFEVGTIHRLPLGMDYNHVVSVVHELLSRCPAGTELVIDGTGIGKPVADIFRWRGVQPWCVTATAGIHQSIDTATYSASVPKLMLISRVQSLLFEQRLRVQADLPEASAFLAELRDFRVEYSASGNMTFNAKSGRNDDMISAAAVAAWRLSDGQRGWGPPSEFLASLALGIAAQYRGDRLPQWVIGVDLGKVADPTALVVMRKVRVPEEARPPPPAAQQPEIRVPWRVRFDEQSARPTPSHPDVTAGEIIHMNGPNAKRTFAPGSMEFESEK